MEDIQIIDLLFQRSEIAIPALQKKFGGLCRSIISRILSDKRDVEECTSDTYLRVWNSIPPHRPERLDCYLARISRNVALDRYDYNTASMRNSGLTCAFEELALYLPSHDSETDAVEFRTFINRFLRSLPQESRMMFLRRYWYADSVEQTANHVGWSVSKTKTVLFRMRIKLKDYLSKEGLYDG